MVLLVLDIIWTVLNPKHVFCCAGWMRLKQSAKWLGEKLLPTVREDGSEVWITWNPERRDSATSQRFRHEEIFDDLTGELIGVGVEMNYSDNPWFPEVLEIERRQDQQNLDDATYRWIWEGDYLELSEAQIFRNKYKVEAFDDELWKTADRLFFGADFGFANDPNTLIRSFILENTLH